MGNRPSPQTQIIHAEILFQADFLKHEISALFPVSATQTFELRFSSPDELLYFVINLMNQAVSVWPEDPSLKDYSD